MPWPPCTHLQQGLLSVAHGASGVDRTAVREQMRLWMSHAGCELSMARRLLMAAAVAQCQGAFFLVYRPLLYWGEDLKESTSCARC